MISVVIAAKNPGNRLFRAVESVFPQLGQGDEIIIVDDYSHDNSSLLLAEKYKNFSNVKLFKSLGTGISAARNLGNSKAQNEYVFVLDSDDYLCEGVLDIVKNEISKFPEVDVLYGNIKLKVKDKIIPYRNYPEFKNAKCAKRMIMAFPVVPFKHSAVIYRKKVIEIIGGYDESLSSKVDIDLALRLVIYTNKIKKINEFLSVHEKHQSQVSRKRLGGMSNYKKVFWKHESNFTKRVAYLGIRFLSELLKHIAYRLRIF
jgi:glycosyltransferase involved in cell wall biosynthesis